METPISAAPSKEYFIHYKQGDWYRTKDIIANGPDWIIN